MKLIKLTQGQFTKVSDEDFDLLSSYVWHALKLKGGFVACRMEKRTRIYMHRMILKAEKHLLVDHINHDSLDNQRHNLRLATHAENRHNSRPNNEPKTSKYLGVSYDRRDKIYVAQLAVAGKQRKVGRSSDEAEAAMMYNNAATKHYGRFANLNVIPSNRESLNLENFERRIK